jgi:hypothetical protein
LKDEKETDLSIEWVYQNKRQRLITNELLRNNLAWDLPFSQLYLSLSLTMSANNNHVAVFSVIYCIILILGAFGNSLVIVAVKRKRSLRTTTNILLANVAVSDIVALVFLPFISLQAVIHQGGFGADFLCKILADFHVPATAFFVSVLTLTILSVERFHAIVKPMREGIRLRDETVRYAVITIWLLAIALTLPLYICSYYDDMKRHACGHRYPSTTLKNLYTLFIITLVLFLPTVTISYCYFQIVKELYFKRNATIPQTNAQNERLAKRKLIRVSLSVTIAFGLFILPLCLVAVLKIFGITSNNGLNFAATFSQLQCVVNPILYSHQSTNFRQAFKEILHIKTRNITNKTQIVRLRFLQRRVM